ncbi:AAA family ATPase [Pseudomonas sp. LFM046]|uniref:AAA family ATPase n=1 Tax=Pseudomonas sp. LFM046 TaxID=1608357 RepID=UPI0005CFEFDA|nr:AAA family ATPase [Pseudomonas sp. LFM046]
MNARAHPLRANRALFITQQMVRVLHLSLDRVAARRSAVLFQGPSRVGKSRCAEYVAEQIREQWPDVFTMLHIAVFRQAGRRHSVLKELCDSEHLSPPAPRVDYLQHLLAHIEGQVTGQPAPQCVLVVDQVQHWLQNDFHVLACLYDYLQLPGIQLTMIGFAQSGAIHERLTGFRALKHDQIVARFFSEILEFKGCQSVEELRVILHACDEGSEFPVDSGISYTAFFAPEAFAAGFRLAPLAAGFWKAFAEQVKGQYINNLPMQHVREAILDLLLLIAPHDSALFEADDRLINEAVYRSGIATFCDAL